MFICYVNIFCILFYLVSSGLDSDFDDSEKNNKESYLFNLSKLSGNDEGVDFGNSIVVEEEDDFNFFRMLGLEDEGE